MAHRFDPSQTLDPPGFLTRATGPVDTGEKMFWIVVLVHQTVKQDDDEKHAAAWGTADWSSDPVDGTWRCKTGMVPGSSQFSNGPAQAWALALVTKENQTQTVLYPWSDSVDLV
jgi:hypothetical protein